MMREPSAKHPALRTSAVSGPNSATTAPPTAGPTVEARRSVTPVIPVARSSGTRARSAASGTMISLARSPGPRAAPISATRPSSRGRPRSPRACSSGTTRAAAALTRSVLHETTRGPTRSTSGPVNALTRTYGAISKNATRPVLLALPVVASTNHGRAMADTRVPVSETRVAVSTPISGRGLRGSPRKPPAAPPAARSAAAPDGSRAASPRLPSATWPGTGAGVPSGAVSGPCGMPSASGSAPPSGARRVTVPPCRGRTTRAGRR